MAVFVLTWNPDVWGTDEQWEGFALSRHPGRAPSTRWSTGSRTSGIDPGDPVLLLRQGRQRGIVALGAAKSAVYRYEHFNDPARMANYVDLEFRQVTTIGGRLRTEMLLEEIPEFPWNHLQGSGVRMEPATYDRVLDLWHDSATAFDVENTT